MKRSPFDDPVAASEGAVHAREEVPAEQELLTEDGGEHQHAKDEGVPAPGAVQERLAGVRSDERGEDPVLGSCERRDQLLAAVTARISGITISQTRPPTRPLRGLRGERSQSASRTVDQRSVRCSRPTRIATRTNCQTRPTVKTHDQCLEHRHDAVAGEPVREHGRDEPGERCHRQRGGRPDGEDPADPQLRNLDTRGGSVSAGSGRGGGMTVLIFILLCWSIPIPRR